MTCSDEEGHPRYANGSVEDPVFVDGEKLFRRYLREHFLDQQLLPSAFQFPRQSFNREKYSTPEDVLHPDCCNGKKLKDWGVLECPATDLPTPIKGPENREFHFKAEHRPWACCYAHTEVTCRENQTEKSPSPKVKELFRIELARRMSVRIVARA
jgi:hypothetical protein